MRKVIVHEFLDTADVQQMIEGEIAGITKATIGLGDVDNTSDTDKPVSSAVQSALDGKADGPHDHDDRRRPPPHRPPPRVRRSAGADCEAVDASVCCGVGHEYQR